MSLLPDLSIRLNARIEILASGDTKSSSGLIMSAAHDRLVLRSPKEYMTGEKIVISGEVSMQDTLSFQAIVLHSAHHQSSLERLNYHQMVCLVPNLENFHKYVKGLKKMSLDMKEDLRILAQLPTKATLGRKKFQTVCENVSLGGVYLKLDEKAPEIVTLDTLEMEIEFPDTIGRISCKGDVVYAINDDEANNLHISPGLGLRLDLDDEEQFLWESALLALHKRILEKP